MALVLPVEILRPPFPEAATVAIFPANAEAYARLEAHKQRVGIQAILRGPPRSRPQEKWYRALVRYVAQGVDMHPDTLHAELRYEAGKINRIFLSERMGKAIELKSSTEMDLAEYAAYVSAATDIVFRDYLPGVRRKDVLDVVDQMARDSRYERVP